MAYGAPSASRSSVASSSSDRQRPVGVLEPAPVAERLEAARAQGVEPLLRVAQVRRVHQGEEVAVGEVVGGVAEQLAPGRVDRVEVAAQVQQRLRGRRLLEVRARGLERLRELALLAELGGDVAQDHRDAGDLAVRIVHRPERDRGLERAAVAPHAGVEEGRHPLAVQQLVEVRRVQVAALARGDDRRAHCPPGPRAASPARRTSPGWPTGSCPRCRRTGCSRARSPRCWPAAGPGRSAARLPPRPPTGTSRSGEPTMMWAADRAPLLRPHASAPT